MMMFPQRGFILVLVLWTLLALTLAASALAAWVSRATFQAIQQADETSAQSERFATLETLKYLLATHPSGLSGLLLDDNALATTAAWRNDPFGAHRFSSAGPHLRYDDTLYQGLGEALFSVQDETGLIGFNFFNASYVAALLGAIDVPVAQRRRLVDRLREYSSHIPNFARDADYRAAGLPEPAARNLLVPLEARWVLDWREHSAIWENVRWARDITAIRGGSVNLNTAPASVLSMMPEIGPRRAQRLIDARIRQPFANVDQAGRVAGLPLDPLGYRVIAGDALRVTLGDNFSQRAVSYSLILTGGEGGRAPWRVVIAHPVNGVDFDRKSAKTAAHSLLAQTASE